MTGRRVRIRTGHLGDLAAVERIERASFSDPWPTTALAQELQPADYRLTLVAELDGEVAAYLMAWATPDELHILNVAVAPRRRRRRLAARLLEEALTIARDVELQAVTLEVRPANTAARALYRGYGFVERGLRPGYYADTGEDALILTLDLTDA